VYGDGHASRDFISVANAVQANLLAAASAPAAATGEAYNIGCGRETSLNELFRMIRLGLAGYQPSVATARPAYGAPRAGDIRRSVANINKARRFLGYEPSQSVEQGLGLAIEWYVTGDVAGTPASTDVEPSVSTR
jgi:nucleoside-diphosphate-sugar epimerase